MFITFLICSLLSIAPLHNEYNVVAQNENNVVEIKSRDNLGRLDRSDNNYQVLFGAGNDFASMQAYTFLDNYIKSIYPDGNSNGYIQVSCRRYYLNQYFDFDYNCINAYLTQNWLSIDSLYHRAYCNSFYLTGSTYTQNDVVLHNIGLYFPVDWSNAKYIKISYVLNTISNACSYSYDINNLSSEGLTSAFGVAVLDYEDNDDLFASILKINEDITVPTIDFINNAYERGKQDGYAEGLRAGEEQTGVVTTIFNGIVTVGLLPVNVFLQMFNYEIFGINISGLVSGFVTIALILIVVRLVMGNKND